MTGGMESSEVDELQPGDEIGIYRDGGWREGWVLAVRMEEALVEYAAPDGATALLMVPAAVPRVAVGPKLVDTRECESRPIPYLAVFRPWLLAIMEGGQDWVGQPQGSARPRVLSVRELLTRADYAL